MGENKKITDKTMFRALDAAYSVYREYYEEQAYSAIAGSCVGREDWEDDRHRDVNHPLTIVLS